MRAKPILSFVCIFLFAACALAQSSPKEIDSQIDTLLALERMWNQAQLSRDVGAIRGMIGDHFVDTEWDGSVSNRGQFLADIGDPEWRPSVLTNADMKVSLYGTTAVIIGAYHSKGISHGKLYEHAGRFTDTWILVGGKWQCVASHTSLRK